MKRSINSQMKYAAVTLVCLLMIASLPLGTPQAALATGPAAVNLGTAINFGALAYSTVTNTGATTVTGDLGLSPGTSVTGFPPGTLVGTLHQTDPTAAQAKLDLTTAYNDALGRTGATIVSGDLGGQTLTPGLYKSTSTLAISSDNLTLDGGGDANAVFIFQIGTGLTTASYSYVKLVNSAQAKNVFWQVGSSATLGTYSVFKGTIMADQSVTLTTGVTLDGRALARSGAVTLDTNTVTVPVSPGATGIIINSPLSSSPVVVKPGSSITVSYSIAGFAPNVDVQLEIYQGTTSISLVTDSNKVPGATYTKTMGISSAAAQGSYILKASIVGTAFVDTEAGAVIVDSTPPTVTIATPNINTCWKSGTTQNIQWSVSDAASTDNVTLVAEYSINGGGSWVGIFSRSNRQGADSYTWTVPAASQPASYVRFTATDIAGNVMTSPQQSSPFKILNTTPIVSMVTPGNTASEEYSAGTAGTTTGRITALITGLPSSTVYYQIGMFVGGVNTDNITSGWQTATLNSSGQFLLSSLSGGGYLWPIENNISSSNSKIGIWARDCAGNVNDPTAGGSTAMSAYTFRIKDQYKPSGTVLWPSAATSVHYLGSSDNVTWNMTDNVAWPTLSYQIWLSYNSGSTYTELIASGAMAQGTNKSVPWSPVTATTTGKIKIDITDGETPTNTQSIYSGPFSIVQGTQPIVSSITVPALGASWAIGSTQNITFTASDPSNTSARLNYVIALAADGTTFNDILSLTNETQGARTFSIAVPDVTQPPFSATLPLNNAKIRVTATNPASGAGSGSLVGYAFSITAASFPVTTETVALKTGWNLVSLPLIPTNSSIQNILGTAISNVECVWTCSGGGATGGTWYYYAPGVTSTLSTMVDGKAYWVKATADTTITFQGRKGNPPPSAPPTYTFTTAGWYMVGYKSTTAHTVLQYAGSNTSGSTTIYTLPITGFNATTQAFTSLASGDSMAKGSGYWFYYNSAGAIAPPSD